MTATSRRGSATKLATTLTRRKTGRKKAWFRPSVEKDRLTMFIKKIKGQPPLTRVVYSYYHGHLIETFLTHHHDAFQVAIATPDAVTGDSSVDA